MLAKQFQENIYPSANVVQMQWSGSISSRWQFRCVQKDETELTQFNVIKSYDVIVGLPAPAPVLSLGHSVEGEKMDKNV